MRLEMKSRHIHCLGEINVYLFKEMTDMQHSFMGIQMTAVSGNFQIHILNISHQISPQNTEGM